LKSPLDRQNGVSESKSPLRHPSLCLAFLRPGCGSAAGWHAEPSFQQSVRRLLPTSVSMARARLKNAARPGGMPKPVRQDAERRRSPFQEFPSRALASVGPARDPFKLIAQPRACRPRPAVRGISWLGNASRGGPPGMCMIPLSGAKAGRFRALRRGSPVRDASTAAARRADRRQEPSDAIRNRDSARLRPRPPVTRRGACFPCPA